MEWVETTGRTIDDAKEAALDQLGVDEVDAEFEVLEEPRRGLFGLLGADARVRARVRPTTPRAKDDRRDRRRRGRGRESRETREGTDSRRPDEPAASPPAAQEATPAGRNEAKQEGSHRVSADDGRDMVDDDVSPEEQADAARRFVDGFVAAFGAPATVSATVTDDAVEVSVTGNDLGLLIGPKGTTLLALQELTRTAVVRALPGAHSRIYVDVAGYRLKRRAALERFTRQVADEVRSTGARRSLEPMGPADRKVVHDTVNELDGVTTISEGEEPRRRVVIVPTSEG